MKLHMILVVGFVIGMMGCAEKEQAQSEPMDEAPMTPPEAVAILEEDQLVLEDELWRNASFIEHMHLHAEHLDELNYALEDGDLEAAKTPANWLSTHDTDSDIDSDWLPYLYGMRTAAEAVETASDLATARAAAMQINAQCLKCHTAVGVSVN